jgi:hypothetical protein
MDEPLWEMIAGRPPARLSPFAAGYVGYRIEGAPPACIAACHRAT